MGGLSVAQGERISRRPRLLMKALYLLLALLTCFSNLRWSFPRGDYLMDFGSFIASGRAVAEGLNPYGVYPLTFRFIRGTEVVAAPNLNPPISVLLFQLLAAADPGIAFRIWYLGSIVLYVVVVVLLLRAAPEAVTPVRVVWALSLGGFWHTLHMGQVYILLLLVFVSALLSLRRGRYQVAGLLVGILIALKPNFLVLPVLLLLAGCATTALSALAVAALLSAAPLLVYGSSVYAQWLEVLRHDTGVGLPTNGSLFGLAARLGIPELGIVIAGALVLVAALWAWRQRPQGLTVSNLAIVVLLLASPLAWAGYTVFLLPVFIWRRWTTPLAIAAMLLILPVPLVEGLAQQSQWHFILFGSIYSSIFLLVLAALVKEAYSPNDRVSTAAKTS